MVRAPSLFFLAFLLFFIDVSLPQTAIAPFMYFVTWYPRLSWNDPSYRPGEYELTSPLSPAGPLHSLSSSRTGKLYTLGTIAINGSVSLYAPVQDTLKLKTSIDNDARTTVSLLYSSFYTSRDMGLSWLPSTILPWGIVRWSSAAVLFEIGPRSTVIDDNRTVQGKSSCSLICIIGGLLPINGTSVLYPTNRMDCSNDEGITWFRGPSLPFAVKRASLVQFGHRSLLLDGGNRYTVRSDSGIPDTFMDDDTNSPFDPSCTRSNLLNDTSTTFTNITIWEARVIMSGSLQCTVDLDYGWVPWNQSTPASNRMDPVILPYWSNSQNASVAETWNEQVTLTNDNYDNNYDALLPHLMIGSGDSPGEYSVPLFDLWLTSKKITYPSNTTSVPTEVSWSLANRQIPSTIAPDTAAGIFHEPIRFFTDLRNGTGYAMRPGKVPGDILSMGSIDHHFIFYMEADRAYVSTNYGRSFTNVFHAHFPNFGGLSDIFSPQISRSLRKVSFARDPYHNFEPVIIGWTYFTGQMWRGDFIACNDSCPVNHWSTGCVKDPYDAVCNPCSVCESGYFAALPCAHESYYYDTYCMKCSICKEGEEILSPCTETKDTVCKKALDTNRNSKNSVTVDVDSIFPLYITAIVLFTLTITIGVGVQLCNRRKSNVEKATATSSSSSSFIQSMVQIFIRTMFTFWPCYGTMLSTINHITLLVILSRLPLLNDLYISLWFILGFGVCFNSITLWYFTVRVSYFTNYDHWFHKVQAIVIGGLSFGHARVLLCHNSFLSMTMSSYGFTHSSSSGGMRSTTGNGSGNPSARESLSPSSSSFSSLTSSVPGNATEWRPTPNAAAESKNSSSSPFIVSRVYFYILWCIAFSTVFMDIPFLFPLLYIGSFVIPTHFMVFLILSTFIDLVNIIFTMIAFGKRLDRLKLVTKLLANRDNIPMDYSKGDGSSTGVVYPDGDENTLPTLVVPNQVQREESFLPYNEATVITPTMNRHKSGTVGTKTVVYPPNIFHRNGKDNSVTTIKNYPSNTESVSFSGGNLSIPVPPLVTNHRHPSSASLEVPLHHPSSVPSTTTVTTLPSYNRNPSSSPVSNETTNTLNYTSPSTNRINGIDELVLRPMNPTGVVHYPRSVTTASEYSGDGQSSDHSFALPTLESVLNTATMTTGPVVSVRSVFANISTTTTTTHSNSTNTNVINNPLVALNSSSSSSVSAAMVSPDTTVRPDDAEKDLEERIQRCLALGSVHHRGTVVQFSTISTTNDVINLSDDPQIQ